LSSHTLVRAPEGRQVASFALARDPGRRSDYLACAQIVIAMYILARAPGSRESAERKSSTVISDE